MLLIFVSFIFTISPKDINAQGGCGNFTEATYHFFGQYRDYEHGSWELIFEDDFNDSVIDKDKWFTCVDGWNREHGNDELQYYLDDNVVVEDGILKLTAKREPGYYDVWRFDNDFHTFSLEWDEFMLIFRVDGAVKRIVYNYYNMLGQSVGNYQSATDGLHTRFALFPNSPQSMILNLAVPGPNSDFGPSPSTQTIFPSSLDIDYVKVYKKTNPDRNITLCGYNSSMVNNYTGKTINVAGDCDVVISGGESLGLIACDEIVLNDGFEALVGSNVDLRISSSREENTMMVNNYNDNYIDIPRKKGLYVVKYFMSDKIEVKQFVID